MESPFKSSTTITMYLEPYLNTYYETYQNIITFSGIPPGPIAQMVATISSPKLSPFQISSPFQRNPYNCMYVLMRYPVGSNGVKTPDSFMTAEDIPAILSYLMQNGYMIDTEITKIIQKSGISMDTNLNGKRKMITMFSFLK